MNVPHSFAIVTQVGVLLGGTIPVFGLVLPVAVIVPGLLATLVRVPTVGLFEIGRSVMAYMRELAQIYTLAHRRAMSIVERI